MESTQYGMTRAYRSKSDNAIEYFEIMMDNAVPRIAEIMPPGMDPNRLKRLVIGAYKNNKMFQRCDASSILTAVLGAAQLGLEIGEAGEAYLIPYKQNCELIIGYQGYLKLAYQSPAVKLIDAGEVYSNDYFDYSQGSDTKLVHRTAGLSTTNNFPLSKAQRGDLLGYYAFALLYDNDKPVAKIMTMDEIEEHREYSPSYKWARKAKEEAEADPKNKQKQETAKYKMMTPWMTHPTEMALKTVIKSLCKLLPKTSILHDATSVESKTISATPIKPCNITSEIIDTM
jgi:recombination protein RecT